MLQDFAAALAKLSDALQGDRRRPKAKDLRSKHYPPALCGLRCSRPPVTWAEP